METERIAYSVKEAAGALGVSQWIVREEIRAGRIKSIRLGARILIPRRELERLVNPPEHSDTTSEADSDTATSDLGGEQE